MEQSALQKEKAALRLAVRQKGEALSQEALRQSDQSITHALGLLPEWQRAKLVFLYVSRGFEPDTRGLIQRAWQEGKGVAVPRCLADRHMEAREILTLDQLRPGRFGLLEPGQDASLALPLAFDLVVAPCLTVDQKGRRLGNGGGYYDRYLPLVACPVVCLCREALLAERVPTDERDVPVDVVVTGADVYRREE